MFFRNNQQVSNLEAPTFHIPLETNLDRKNTV